MKQSYKLLLPSLLILLAGTAQAQWASRWEIIGKYGVSSYSGDIGGDQTKFGSDHMKKLGNSYGLGARYIVNNSFSVQFGFNYAMVSGADSFASNRDRQLRNLSFRTPITEGFVKAEVSLLNWMHVRSRSHRLTSGSNFYLYGGFSFFKFDPQGYYNGTWHSLQPLGTEGQGIMPGKGKYSLSSTALLGGFGYRQRLSNRFSLGMEFGMRYTATDYLDDVSTNYYDNAVIESTYGTTAAALADPNKGEDLRVSGTKRGSPKQKDYYFIGQLTLAFKLGDSNAYSSQGGGRRFRTRNRCFHF